MPLKRYISFSLYGGNPLYSVGMAENIAVAPKVYPGWTVVVHADEAAAANLTARVRDGYELKTYPPSNGHSGMFWRFRTAWEADGECTIFRDADSRLNVREKAAVDAWLASGRMAHVMRDHPDHKFWPMLGGMWGLRNGSIPLLPKLMSTWEDLPEKLQDMQFLRMVVWPLIKDDMVHHSSVETPVAAWEPFPAHEAYTGFVGEIVRVKEEGRSGGQGLYYTG